MQRLAIRLGSFLITALLAAQLFLPPYLESRVADRLTENGGTADVELSAIPSVRLLAGNGHKLEIRATGLNVPPSDNDDTFRKLDKFDEVFIYVNASEAGPFDIEGFLLDRRAEHRYRVIIQADTSAADLGRYAAGGLGGIAGAIVGGGVRIPIDVRVMVDTSSGEPRAIEAQGTVAGFPTGPAALLVVNAVLSSF